MGRDVYALRNQRLDGAHVVSLEIDEPCGRANTLEGVLARFCDLLEATGPEGRAAWDACSSRDFNAGFDSAASTGPSGRMFEAAVSAGTLARIAALGGTLTVTIYPLFRVPPRVRLRARARNVRHRRRSKPR